jgi:hypothetical protein
MIAAGYHLSSVPPRRRSASHSDYMRRNKHASRATPLRMKGACRGTLTSPSAFDGWAQPGRLDLGGEGWLGFGGSRDTRASVMGAFSIGFLVFQKLFE